jgi:hypothetical protein
MVMSASETRGCCPSSDKTVAHVVELLNFVQDRSRMHGVRGFPKEPRRRKMATRRAVQTLENCRIDMGFLSQNLGESGRKRTSS